jgi:hypothetical protein
MKVVTARATSVTGDEQSFDEQVAVGSRQGQSRRRAEALAVAGQEQSGGMCFRAGVAVRRGSR